MNYIILNPEENGEHPEIGTLLNMAFTLIVFALTLADL